MACVVCLMCGGVMASSAGLVALVLCRTWAGVVLGNWWPVASVPCLVKVAVGTAVGTGLCLLLLSNSLGGPKTCSVLGATKTPMLPMTITCVIGIVRVVLSLTGPVSVFLMAGTRSVLCRCVNGWRCGALFVCACPTSAPLGIGSGLAWSMGLSPSALACSAVGSVV